MSIKENSIVEQYVQKFAEKFLKIFKKLGVKVVSENVVKEEFEGAPHQRGSTHFPRDDPRSPPPTWSELEAFDAPRMSPSAGAHASAATEVSPV